MRRSDRKIKEISEIIRVMEQCEVCRLAFHDKEYPYILPLNFGLDYEDGEVKLYFHGAGKGKKYELIGKDNRVSFEMDHVHRLVTGSEACSCSMEYESVIGRGRIELVPEKEKRQALDSLMKHYHLEELAFSEAVISKTTVMKLVVEEMTGKRHMER